jgi:hypothetical protein
MYTLVQKKQEHLEVKRKNRPKLLKTLPTGLHTEGMQAGCTSLYKIGKE